MHRRRLGCRRSNDNGVIHGAVVGQNLHHLRNRGTLLPDGTVNANQIVAFVVDDGVNGDRGLSGLTVADDQFALAAANGDHAVDCLKPGGHRLTHRLALDHAGRNALDGDKFFGGDRTFVVDRIAKRVHHAANHCVADGNAHDASSALDLVAFFNFGVVAKQHHAHLVFFQIHGDAGKAVRKRQQLARHDFFQAMDARNTVAEGDDGADFIHGNLRFVILNLLPDKLCDFVCSNLHKFSS